MKIVRFISFSALPLSLFSFSSSALAQQQPNLSDITGPNVSDITGPNVSDITGPNVSDITGTSPADARTRRAVAAGLDNDSVDQIAEDLGIAYDVCVGGGDCSSFYTLLEQSNSILGE